MHKGINFHQSAAYNTSTTDNLQYVIESDVLCNDGRVDNEFDVFWAVLADLMPEDE